MIVALANFCGCNNQNEACNICDEITQKTLHQMTIGVHIRILSKRTLVVNYSLDIVFLQYEAIVRPVGVLK